MVASQSFRTKDSSHSTFDDLMVSLLDNNSKKSHSPISETADFQERNPDSQPKAKSHKSSNSRHSDTDGVAQLQEILVKPDIVELRQKVSSLRSEVTDIEQQNRQVFSSVQKKINHLQADFISQSESQEQRLSLLQEQVEQNQHYLTPAIAQLQQEISTNRQMQQRLLDAVLGDLKTMVVNLEQNIVVNLEQKIVALEKQMCNPSDMLEAITPIINNITTHQQTFQKAMFQEMKSLIEEVASLRREIANSQETQLSIQVAGIE